MIKQQLRPQIFVLLLLHSPPSLCTAEGTRDVSVTPAVLSPGGEATVHYQGRFADKPNLTIHYGFNGWNRVDGADDLAVKEHQGNQSFSKDKVMTKLPGGGFRVTIDLPTGARALHFVFYFNDDGRKRWDNRERRDYRAALTIPYIGPYLTWNQNTDPDGGVVINYQTAMPALSRLEYGSSPSLGKEPIGSELRESHHVELTGLDANTTYHYRVYGSNGVPSPTHAFKTSATAATAFSFAVMADVQDNGDDRRWKDVADELMANHNDVAFMLIVGDMPWENQPGHWWTFFDKGRQLLASKVMMPATGNHDTPQSGSNPDTSTFEDLFDLPTGSGSETFYAFRFGNARFMSLNSEVRDQFRQDSGAQYEWMRDQLASHDASSQWVFAYWHIPPYDAADRHYREQGRFRDMTELFDAKVDWVFSGHEHLYQRFKPLRYNAKLVASGVYGNDDNEGVGYLILPPAGNAPATELVAADSPKKRYRDRLAFPKVTGSQDRVDSEIGFVTVSIDGTTIDMRTFGMGTLERAHDSHVIDAVSYTK